MNGGSVTNMAKKLASVLVSGGGFARASREEMAKSLRLFLGVTIFALGSRALASDVKVIVNPSVHAESIPASELRAVFLEESSSLAGAHVEPVLAKSGRTHDAFLREYIGLTDYDLQAYYHTLVFTGRGAIPKTLNSDAEVVAYVARTRGAIGYVSADARDDGVRILTVVSAETSERKLIHRVQPDYPTELRANSIGGTVRLLVTITPAGSVVDVKIVGGDAALGAAAARAVAQWKYAPAPSRTSTEVTLTFGPQP